MRSLLSILFCTYFLLFLFHPFMISASENNDPSTLIQSFEEDVTGDGFREHLTLRGTLLTNSSKYYVDVWLDIVSPFSTQWKISLDGGYDPVIQFIDLNKDHVSDLLYRIAKDEKEKQYDYQLYTLRNGTVEQVPLPKHNHIQGKFLDDYQIEIKINPTAKPIIKDVSNKKDLYAENNIYDQEGKLLKERMIKPASIHLFEPILISKTKGHGLKSLLTVKGIGEEDILGEIETLWYYHNDKWIILKSDWIDH